MRNKKIFILLLVIVCLVIGSVYIVKSGLLVRSFKSTIETELSKVLDKKVTIGRIEGGIFNNLILHNVRISIGKGPNEETIVTINKVIIKYSIFDIIFKKKEVFESIKDIKLIKPKFILNKDIESLNSNSAKKFSIEFKEDIKQKFGKIPQALNIEIEDADILIRDKQTQTSFATLDRTEIKIIFPELKDKKNFPDIFGFITSNKIKIKNFNNLGTVQIISITNSEVVFKYSSNFINISKIKSNIFGGSLSGNIDIDLSSGFLDVMGNARLRDIKLKDYKIPDQKILFNYSKSKLNVESEAFDGGVKSSFKLDFNKRVGFPVSGFMNIKKYEIKNIIKYKNITGFLNGYIKVKSDFKNVILSGNSSVIDFKIDDFRLSKLYIEWSLNNNILIVDKFLGFQTEGGYVSGKYKFDLSGIAPVEGKFSGRKINLAGLNFSRFSRKDSEWKMPDLFGYVNFDGSVDGKITEPDFRISINSNGLIINNGERVKINGRLMFNNKRVEIEELKIDDEYDLHCKLIFYPKRAIFLRTNIKEGKLKTLVSIIGLKIAKDKIKGVISGKINLKSFGNTLSGDGFVNARNITINKFNIDEINTAFMISKNILKIIKFDLNDKQSTSSSRTGLGFTGRTRLLAKAELFFGDTINFKVNADFLNEFKGVKFISGITGTGEIVKAPDFSFNGNFKTDTLRIGIYSFPAIQANLEYKNNELKFAPVSWGNWVFVHGSLKLNESFVGSTSTISANIDFKNMPVQEVVTLTSYDMALPSAMQDKNRLKGYLHGFINIKGEIMKPDISGFLKVDDGEIRNVKFKTLYLDFTVKRIYNITLNMLRLQQKDGIISANGRLIIPEGRSIKDGNIDLDLEISSINATDMHKLVGATNHGINESGSGYPGGAGSKSDKYFVSGKISAKSKVTGTINSPKLTGIINVSDAKIFDIDTKELTTNFTFDKGIFFVDDLNWKNKDGNFVIKSGEIRKRKNNLELFLKFKEFKLLVAGVNFSGAFDFTGIVNSLKTYIGGIIKTEDFKFNNYDISNMIVELFYTEGRVRINGHVPDGSNKRQKILADLSFYKSNVIFNKCEIFIGKEGKAYAKGTLSKNQNSKFGLSLERLDLEDVSKILNITTVDLTGKVDLYAELSGKFGSTKITGNVKLYNGSIEDVMFDSLGSGIQIINNVLEVKKGYLYRKDKYNVDFSGSIPLGTVPKREINFNVNIDDGDLELLSFLGWFEKTKGKVNARLHVSGMPDYPVLNGFAEVKDPSILYPKALVKEIKNFDARFEFKDNKASIVFLSGDIGKGSIKATGYIILKRLDAHLFDFKITTLTKKDGIDFNVLGLMDKIDTGKMHLSGISPGEDYFTITGPAITPKFSGKITLYQTKFTYPLQVSEDEASGFEFLKDIYWDVKVVSESNNWYYNDYCNINVRKGSSIAFIGPGRNIKVIGFAESDKGTFKYLQTDFNLNYAAIKFVEDKKSRMLLTAKAETRVKDIRVYAEVTGDRDDKKQEFGEWEKWNVKLSSVPELTQQQIVSYIVIGEDYTLWSDKEINQKLQTDFASILVKQGVNIGLNRSGAIRTIKKITTLDEIGVKPGGYRSIFGTGTSSGGSIGLFEGTEIDLGKYLTDSLYLGYNIVYQGVLPYGDLSVWRHELKIEYILWQRMRGKLKLNKDEVYGGFENVIPF